MTLDKKHVFFRLPMEYRYSVKHPKKVIMHAGTAIAAVQRTGQQVFAEIVTDDRDQLWTNYYTLNPEGL